MTMKTSRSSVGATSSACKEARMVVKNSSSMTLRRNLHIALLCLGVASHLAAADPSSIRFRFRPPHAAAYHVDETQMRSLPSSAKVEWLKAWPENGSTNFVELGNRVVLQLKSANDLKGLITGSALEVSRTI